MEVKIVGGGKEVKVSFAFLYKIPALSEDPNA